MTEKWNGSRGRLIVGRRAMLKGAAAFGALSVVPGALRPAFAQDKPVVVNSIRSLTNPYHATWNKGGEAFAKSVGRRVRDAGHRRQQREGHRRHQGDARQDRRQLRHQRRPQRQPGRARRSSRRAKAAGAYVVTQWNKPARPAPLGFRPELRRPHLLQRRALRQGHGRGADQGHGRQGRHRGAGRHPVQRAGHRAQAGPGRGAGGQSRRQAARLPGRQLVGDRGAREDQRLADPVRRRDQGHLGGQRRHGAGRGRGAARRGRPARCR